MEAENRQLWTSRGSLREKQRGCRAQPPLAPPLGPGGRNTTGLPLTAAKNKVGRIVRYLCI